MNDQNPNDTSSLPQISTRPASSGVYRSRSSSSVADVVQTLSPRCQVRFIFSALSHMHASFGSFVRIAIGRSRKLFE